MLTIKQLEKMKKYNGLVEVVPYKEWQYGLTVDQANEIATLFNRFLDDEFFDHEIDRLRAEKDKPSNSELQLVILLLKDFEVICKKDKDEVNPVTIVSNWLKKQLR